MPEGLGPVDPAAFGAWAAALVAAALTGVAMRPGWVVERPRTVLLALLAVTLGAASVLIRPDPLGLRLSIDPSTESLLPDGDPGIAVYRRAVLDFGDDQVFVVAMHGEDVFRPDELSALRRVTDAISRIEGVRSVKSLARVTSFRYSEADDWVEVQPFLGEIPTEPGALLELRERAIADPVYRRNLVSEDGRTAAINVSFREMTDLEFISADVDGRIRAILDAETTPGRRFYVSGRPHIKSRMYSTMTRDLRVLIPVCIAVVALVLALITGTLRGVVLPMATVTTAIVWTFGAIALLERPLTVLTVLLAPTLIAIGSVYGVHVVNHYEEEAAAGGDRSTVVRRCLAHMIVPVMIAGLTTMVGYAALLVTDVPAVFEIGAFSVLGVASVTLISLTGIPAALVLLPMRPPAGGARTPARFALAGRLRDGLDGVLEALIRLTRRRSGAVLLGGSVVTVAALLSIPRISIDTDYLTFFDEDAEVRREFDAINRLLAGVVPLFVVLEGAGPGHLRDPEVLRSIEGIQKGIDEVPGVSRTDL